MPGGFQGAFRCIQVTGFADQVTQAAKHLGGNAVAGGNGVIGERLGALNQVFMNLLLNAIDAVDDGGEIALCTRIAPADRVVLEVRDQGKGIAAEKLVEAARILNAAPQSLQLRYLQTLTEIAGEKSSTIVFPLPMDSIGNLIRPTGSQG